MQRPLVSLKGLTMVYRVRHGFLGSRDIKPVDGVDLDVGEGEAVALVGESGCGKTTVGKLSIRLLRPKSGRIFYDGEDVTDLPAKRLQKLRRETRMIFQDPYSSINPYMAVGETVEEPLIAHGVEDKRERMELVYKALEDVRLTPPQDVAARFPHLLSGGQRQRVAIARAIVLKPRYMVADEPVSMIDASSRAEVLEVLKRLQTRHGIAFLYITHDLATARYFSDRIAVMYLGKVVELGQVEEVLSEPLHPYTQALIASIPEPDPANRFGERPAVKGEPPSPQNIPSGCRFHPRCPKAFERCPLEEPQLREVRRGRYVACHLY
ncbi:MAG: ABC transporter ATP-binding protein [Candidatus Caldarchaeum sp.]|nr:ABC transporter ATP-binding protein [Candidatus Caldarchaeum sp.]MDW8358970.1 ABC transporter ATP-binding protein [Candidatus Caldarchaeum sp.]